MKRALDLAGKCVLVLLLGAAALAALALAEPGWLLNTRTASAAVRRFGRSYRPRWTGLGLEVRSPGLRTKRIVFHAENFCVDDEGGAVKGCLDEVKLDATLRLGLSPPARLVRLETLVVRTGPLVRVDERAAGGGKAAKKSGSSAVTLTPGFLRGMTVGLITVRVPRAELVSSSGTTALDLSAGFAQDADAPLTAELYAVVTGTAPSVVSHYRAKLRLDSDLLRRGEVSRLDLKATVTGDGGFGADLDAAVRNPRPGELALKARAAARSSGLSLRAELDGRYDARRAAATASVVVEDPAGPVRRAALERCRFDAPLSAAGPDSLYLRCAIAASPKSFGLRKPQSDLAGTLAFHAGFTRGRARAERFTARLDADVAPGKSWYALFARLGADFSGKTADFPNSLAAKYDLKAGLTIQRFQDLVEALSGTELALPAPLNALDGRVSFEAHAAGDARAGSQRVDYSASTALASKKERVVTALTGRVTIDDLLFDSRRVKDETDLRLKDVALELPWLKLGPVPNPVADSRIKTGDPKRDAGAAASARAARAPAAKSTATAVDYDVRVRTDKPLLLSTNLNKDAIPISLDLRAVPAGGSGLIRVEPFDVKIFRQTARVDHVALTLTPGASDTVIDGKIVYKKMDTVIDILILGSVEKPAVTFESTPPMTENEIVSLLLYGKDPAELDSDQTASAGTASAGFTSGAFGLGSLFLFASTPVDSVSYDPATQTYEVKFKLPGGATLGVGEGTEESRTVSVRRRIARNLDLETEVNQNDPMANGRNDVTTFLEWFQRY